MWNIRKSFWGECLHLNAQKAFAKIAALRLPGVPGDLDEENFGMNGEQQLRLTVGLNKSDDTYGWKGIDNSLTLYYSHPSMLRQFSFLCLNSYKKVNFGIKWLKFFFIPNSAFRPRSCPK